MIRHGVQTLTTVVPTLILSVLVSGLALLSDAAFAHNALVPHEHPHGVSAFAGIEILLALFALPLIAYAAYRYLRRS